MKYLLILVGLIFMIGCSEESDGVLADNENETDPETEALFAEEIREDLFVDTEQMREMIREAFRDERRLTTDEEVLLSAYNSKYESDKLNFHEETVTGHIFMLDVIRSQYVRGEVLLDSEDSYRTQFAQRLKELDDLLEELEIME